MDVDKFGKASGPFLRARIAIELSKPIKRGVLLKMSRGEAPEWFDARYEKLPFFCRSCGVIGHSDLICATPAQRDEGGKLPYDITLRVDDRRRKPQGFAEAAAESLGSVSSSSSKHTRGSSKQQEEEMPKETYGTDRDDEVTSPLKEKTPVVDKNKNTAPPVASRPLFQSKPARKRKTKTVPGSATPDLNLPVQDPLALVPAGTVSARISQLDGVQEEDREGKEELLKKQKMCSTTFDARSAAAADGSPRRAQ
jgi:hypothetical protein